MRRRWRRWRARHRAAAPPDPYFVVFFRSTLRMDIEETRERW
ncbi:hypothetical protein SEA_VANLEE_5 [Gordonia phage VanLee]|uniref:Uncharacterized protein n=1 Tax=Gordonia phage VanLee TaxID=2845816 RepID=A0A8F2D9B3_9CAUD|nr:hypothetical protein QEH49_gp005 [Gordonia phage VanLee]QWS68123.1 hypothetical protein SEA_VANLEE_5 [Gordonia phage VanLee]